MRKEVPSELSHSLPHQEQTAMLSHRYEPLAAGSSFDCTNVSDPKPKDVTSVGNEDDSEATQIPEVSKYGSCPLP